MSFKIPTEECIPPEDETPEFCRPCHDDGCCCKHCLLCAIEEYGDYEEEVYDPEADDPEGYYDMNYEEV